MDFGAVSHYKFLGHVCRTLLTMSKHTHGISVNSHYIQNDIHVYFAFNDMNI